MSQPNSLPSRAAHTGGGLGLLAVVTAMAGLALAYSNIVAPFTGFLVVVLGGALALAGLVTSLVGLGATRGGRRTGRHHAVRGFVLSALVVLAVLFPAAPVSELPRINDITTNFDAPPQFVSPATLDANRGRDMDYPGETFARQQLRSYPDLGPLVLEVPPAEAYTRALTALEAMPHMTVVFEDSAAGHIEAVAVSPLFHFRDDFVVQVRENPRGSQIDVRSKSRDGKGDLGVNAERIREFFARVKH